LGGVCTLRVGSSPLLTVSPFGEGDMVRLALNVFRDMRFGLCVCLSRYLFFVYVAPNRPGSRFGLLNYSCQLFPYDYISVIIRALGNDISLVERWIGRSGLIRCIYRSLPMYWHDASPRISWCETHMILVDIS